MSKIYRDWITEQACCVTDYLDKSDPHHIAGYKYLFNQGVCAEGYPRKISDLACIPLKHEIHADLHNIGWVSWEKKHNVSQLEVMIRMILKAEKEGIIRFG